VNLFINFISEKSAWTNFKNIGLSAKNTLHLSLKNTIRPYLPYNNEQTIDLLL